MTDTDRELRPVEVQPDSPELEQQLVIPELPLWRIRLQLARKSWRQNWGLFKENKVGLIGLGIIIFFVVGAVAQWILVERGIVDPFVYDPVTGNEPNPPQATKVIVDEVTDPATEISLRQSFLIDPFLAVGDEVLIKAQPAPPYICAFADMEGECHSHILGTDPLGRDVLSQLFYGARAAFFMSIIAALVTVFVATFVGSLSAHYGGAIDSFFMRLADLLLMLPALAILIVMNTVVDFQLWHLGAFLGLLFGFGGTAIILKSQALSVKVKPFIDAARVSGGTNMRIIFRHLVPNVMPLSFLYMMFTVTAAIAIEATLSFLGLMNVDMSWGIMIQLTQTQGYLLAGLSFWWLLFPAGLAVTLLAGAFYLVGRGMDEIVNPRLRQR